jgi:quinol monooxygenase YgiN
VLIIAGTFEVEPGRAESALAATASLVEATRAEPGCRDYVFTIDPTRENTLRLFEIWDDEAALAAHFETPHLLEFRRTRQQLGIVGSDVTRYEIAASGPVG